MKKILVLLLTALALVSCDTSFTSDTPEVRSITFVDTEKPDLLLAGDSRVILWPEGYFEDEWDVKNIGVGGDTSYDTAHAILRETHHYDTIVISVGINDFGHFDVPIQDSITALNACIERAKEKADHVFITTIPGCRNGGAFLPAQVYMLSLRAAQLNAWIPILADNHFVTMIPLAGLMNTGWYLKAQYDDGTGIHYNASGYADIYALYQPYIGPE